MLKATDIIGYGYNSDIWTPRGVIEALINQGRATIAARDMPVEDALDQIAEHLGIDRHDESTFDSGEFPKIILFMELDDEWGRNERGQYVRFKDEWKYD